MSRQATFGRAAASFHRAAGNGSDVHSRQPLRVLERDKTQTSSTTEKHNRRPVQGLRARRCMCQERQVFEDRTELRLRHNRHQYDAHGTQRKSGWHGSNREVTAFHRA